MRTRSNSKLYDFSENGADGALAPMTVPEVQRRFFTNPDGREFRGYKWVKDGLEAGATTVAGLVAHAEVRQRRGMAAARAAGRRSAFGTIPGAVPQKTTTEATNV